MAMEYDLKSFITVYISAYSKKAGTTIYFW